MAKSAAGGYQVGRRPRDFGQPVRCRDAVVDRQFLDQESPRKEMRPHGRATFTDELREAERRLQVAPLAGNIAALDQLLDDRVV
ncbi:MAG TPA: hypothetical protein VFW64_05525 [Pseudonocardiaceae bacterium]|nr:hypothetical protein [Pseudonocardiaceae bacterium]